MQGWTEQPWERQKGESEKAFEAFKLYRDMGSARTISAVVKKLGKSRALLDRWKDRWSWKDRVRAYDNELEKKAKEKAARDLKNMTTRHIGIAMQLQQKALEALQNLPFDAMAPKDIKEFIKMATELERLNRTLEEDSFRTQEEGASSLADSIVAAYQKRKESENA